MPPCSDAIWNTVDFVALCNWQAYGNFQIRLDIAGINFFQGNNAIYHSSWTFATLIHS